MRAHLFISHTHADHIQGLPFFVPAYVPSTRLGVFGPKGAKSGVRESLDRQMSAPHFPVALGDLRASIEWNDLDNGQPRQINLRFANVKPELYAIEGDIRPVIFAPGEHAVIDPEVRHFRYVMVYGGQARAEVVR